MNKYKNPARKYHSSFNGTLNLSLNQYRCPKCFTTLRANIHYGTVSVFRYKGSDYYWVRDRSSPNLGSIKNVLNIKIGHDISSSDENKIYSRLRAKIYDHNNNILRKQKFIKSTAKPFLFCKKCGYVKQLCCFASKPNAQLIKRVL